MGKSLIRIVESIKEDLSAHHITDDIKLDDEFLIDKINGVRASLIRKELAVGRLSQDYYQELCCIEVTCEEKGCYIGETFYKSGTVIWKAEIPGLMNGVGSKNLLAVGNDNMLVGYNDGSNVFHRTSVQNFMLSKGQRMLAHKKTYTNLGSTLYLKNLPQDTRFICAIALLFNPVLACNYYEDEDNYPVPSELGLETLVKKDILSTFGIPPDKINDADDSPISSAQAGRVNRQQNNEE